jgi:hypothetical protein
MPVNFFPNREQMAKVIEQCVASENDEVLLCFCNSCEYKMRDENTLVTQCFKCSVQQGIMEITNANRWPLLQDREFVGAC